MKKILFSLFVWFVWLIWFWYCDTVWVSTDNQFWLPDSWTFNITPWSCIKANAWNWCERWFNLYDTSNNLVYNAYNSLSYWFGWFVCVDFDWYLKNENWTSCMYTVYVADWCSVDTWAILSWSCDINYCVENWLCPTSTWSRSELKINDIVHEWRPLINLSIPDYIQRDYTVDENQYDIYVWSWYDQDYIDSILSINSYRPDSEDFTQIFVSWLTLIFPYIFVALLIVFMWKLLKRVFK